MAEGEAEEEAVYQAKVEQAMGEHGGTFYAVDQGGIIRDGYRWRRTNFPSSDGR